MCSIDHLCFYEMSYGSENHDVWLKMLNYPEPNTRANLRKVVALQDQMVTLPHNMMPMIDLEPFAVAHGVSPFGRIVAAEVTADVKALATPFSMEGVLTHE